MSFWRFKFATGNTIDSLLNAIPPTISNPPTLADIALFDTTLDSLLAAPDLLSEIKSGTNQKLRDFLARDHVVQRLGGWILWGLGGEEVEVIEGTGAVGIVADDIEDGKVPDDIIGGNGTISKKKLGMGRIIRRRDMDLMGILEGGTDETEDEKACNGHPRLCTEIISSDVPGLTDMLYNHEAASSQPDTCPSPVSFILPFWKALLRSTEVQLETRAIQVGYWARVNSVLLNGPKGSEVLAQILTIPHILPRLLALLPICSPINDILLLLLRTSKSLSTLTISLIPQTLRMLDPQSPLGKEGHVAAEELLRGVIELCSAAAPPLPPPLSNGIGELPPAHLIDGGLEWRENTLARQISAERSIQMVVDWILAGTEQPISSSSFSDTGDAEVTPKIGKIGLPIPSRPTDPLDDLRTSSLVQSISVLIDLIRKNNSDFVEQQMLTWARRKEMEAKEKELDDEVADVVDGLGSTKEDLKLDSDRGPSLVDLGPLLRIIAGRLGGFQELIKSPRSPFAPISTTAGIITPLTQERFRICEFYAELLHCSNMSLVNRPISLAHLYDSEGFLATGWKSADDLSDALAGVQEEEEREIRMPSSPGQVSRSTYDTSSPVEITMNYSSGLSTPSGNGSLDSESGILTRAEVKELNQVVAGALAEDGDENEDPFGDPSSQDGGSESNDTTEEFKSDGEEVTQNGNIAKLNHSIPDYIPPGLLLKKVFMEHRVIETVLDMFFDFPWNNFLHNVVFDIIQQIFHGRIDRELDRQLVLSVFLDGRVIDRILGGQRANDLACAKPQGTRLGYMGHMSLIAEEVVKLFHHYPSEVYSIVEPHIPQPGWDHYVTTTLRETRERDLSPLGGGISMVSHETASSTASGLSDEDDEFPERGVRGRAVDLNASTTSSSTANEINHLNGIDGIEESTESASTASDKFSQYLANAISSDRADKFGSSDEDDEDDDAGWLGGTQFDPGDVDFALTESSAAPTKFGFDDRFESTGKQVFRSTSPDSDDDADWGPYSTDSPAKKSDNFSIDDGFSPTVSSTSVTFESSFSSFGADDFASSSSTSTSAFPTSFTSFDTSDSPVDVDDDDFGDFETGSSMETESGDATISLPSEVLSDFDFEEDSRDIPEAISTTSSNATTPTTKTFSIFGMKRPSFERTVTADDGSDLFGGLSLDEPEVVLEEQADGEQEQEKEGADKATTLEESLGPNMHEGSHLKDNGGKFNRWTNCKSSSRRNSISS